MCNCVLYVCIYELVVGRDNVVGIVTPYGLDGPVVKSQWGVRFSLTVHTSFGAQLFSSTMGTGLSPGVKWLGRGIVLLAISSSEIKKGIEL